MPVLIACIKDRFSHDKVLKLKIGPPKDVHIKGAWYTWAATRENLSSGVVNNTGADQPAHPRSLISAFVIRFTICKLATSEISIF